MTPREAEIREAILEGMAIELIPHPEKGWYARIGILDQIVWGPSAAGVLLNIADLLSAPPEVATQ